MYVATIHAKVARILKKLGLGQAKGQELLYSHLVRLQAMLDKVGQSGALHRKSPSSQFSPQTTVGSISLRGACRLPLDHE